MKKTQLLIIALFTLVNSYGQDFELVPYRIKTKWGFADSTGTVKIKPVYQDVIPFNRGYSAFKRDNKWGIIDRSGREILEAKYDSVGEYFQGFYVTDKTTNKQIVVTGLRVFKDGNSHYIDIAGNDIFKESGPQYLSIVDDDSESETYKNKIELIKANNKVGFRIKESGFKIVPQYDSLIYSDTNYESLWGNGESPYFLAKKNNKWGIITTNNTEKLAFEYDNLIELEFNGNKLFKKDGKWGVMDKDFSTLQKNVFDSLIYENEVFLAELADKWSVYDEQLRIVIPLRYSEIKMTPDCDGFYLKDSNNKWGYCDRNGEIKIPIEFSFLDKFHYEDCFKYSNDNEKKGIGLVNIDRTIRIAPVYDDVEPFENGYALVVKKDKRGYINKDGLEFFKK